MRICSGTIAAAIVFAAVGLAPSLSAAETITGALIKAYQNNSQLNSARAGLRATDEGVAIAKSGWRPNVIGSASVNYSSTSYNGAASQAGNRLTTGNFGVQIQQSLFDGFQTLNNVEAATARVLASRESLRNTEQNILFNAATAYMDVIRDRHVADLTQQNLQFLNEQVRAARSRFEVGEGTRTDVAQAEASRSAAEAQLTQANARVLTSSATYRQIIGDEPGNLKVPAVLKQLLPSSLAAAEAIAAIEHPAILANEHLVDVAAFSVKSAEGALLPQVSATATVSRNYRNTSPGTFASLDGTNDSASIGATLTVPIYQGGRVYAEVRQSKETLGQARIEVDVSRDQVQQAITSAWTQYQASIQTAIANRQLVAASQLALNGVIEERNVGQRTTLDVLNAQADVITGQINLASSERDVVVASYAILSAMGRLSARVLGLQVANYNPKEHFDAVKDKWIGLRTPDGR